MRTAIIVMVLALSFQGVALAGECRLMGDYAVQFTQYRDGGKSLQWVLNYIDKNVTRNTSLYRQMAKSIYSMNLSPRENRVIFENMCRDARGY